MARYLIRRVLQTVLLLLVVSLVVFALVTQAPGGPGILLDRNVGPAEMARMRAILGLDQPLHVQYVRWLEQVLRGNLGISYQAGVPVLEIIGHMLPNTLLLSAAALALSLVVAIPAGVISAARPYSATDHAVTSLALIGISVPTFWLGLMLIVVFSIGLGWLPPGGMQTIGAPASALDVGRHLALPAVVLGSANMALFARYTRSSTMAVLRQDYVRTARSKGLSEWVVVSRHALRNASIPAVTLIGLTLFLLWEGAVVTERIFNWPGVGRLAFTALTNKDYPVVQAIVFLAAISVTLGNLFVDLMYAYLDPRISYVRRR